MPAPIYHVYPPERYWSGMWESCDVDREIALCAKRELAAHLLCVLRNLENPLIVEAGCGVGAWVLFLKQLGFQNVIGVDNYEPSCQTTSGSRAEKRLKEMCGICLLAITLWMCAYPLAWLSISRKIQPPVSQRWRAFSFQAAICF